MKSRLAATLGVVIASFLAAVEIAASPVRAPTPSPTPKPEIKITRGSSEKHGPPVVARAASTSVPPSSRASDEPALLVYRIETSRGVLFASDHPMQAGDLVSFHEHPNGTLVSLRRSEIQHVVVERRPRFAQGPRPGDAIDIGITGSAAGSRAVTVGGAGAASGKRGLGERSDGTALLNPDRKYQGDIDSKQVPGLNMGLPNSANDYREGRTLGYPAAPATQSAPGEPPKMPDSKPN